MDAAKIPPSWKEKLPSTRPWSMASLCWNWNQGERVKVEGFTGTSKPDKDKKERTPVLVRVTASPLQVPIAVDVVAVLNMSSGMEGKKLEQMQQEAMQAVIDNLGPKDRLSIVYLNDNVCGEMELVSRTDLGTATAEELINGRISSAGSYECVDDSAAAALEAAGRQKAEGDDSRLRCLMLLSGGNAGLSLDNWISRAKEEFKFGQVHAFCLGTEDDDAPPLECIANEHYAATYSFVNATRIGDAFKAFIGGLKSVVATSVNVGLKAQGGFRISSVVTGGHMEHFPDRGTSHAIHIADMYAGEQKNFVVYLTREGAANKEKLVLVIDGEYRLGYGKESDSGSLPAKEITMKSSVFGTQRELAAELARINLVKKIKEMASQKAHPTGTELREAWVSIKDSDECRAARSTVMVEELDKDVAVMVKQQGGQAYMLSWLSCHWWQRATTMSHYSCAFRSRSTWTWRWEFFASDSCRGRSCLGLGVGVVAVVFLLLYLLLGGRHQPGIILTPSVITDLDVQNHPHWPSMEEFNVMLRRADEDDKITSFFKDKGASSRDMKQQIDQYLYMAIVYAAVLRARYEGIDDFPDKFVRSQAAVYLNDMITRTKNGPLPALKIASTETLTSEMSHYLYSAIVQTKVLVTIHDPISPPKPPVGDKDKQIEELKGVIASLKLQIEEMENCCQLANLCRQRVISLGGSDDFFEAYVKKSTIFMQFERKGLSPSEAAEFQEKLSELGGIVGDSGS